MIDLGLNKNQQNMITISLTIICIQIAIYLYMNEDKRFKWPLAILLVCIAVVYRFSTIKLYIR